MIAHVWREAFGAAEEFLNAGLLKRRHTAHRIQQKRFEMFEAACDFVKAEIFGNSVHTPWSGIRFKCAHKQFARVIFVIAAIIIIAQHGERIVDPLDPFKQHVIMFARVQWRSHAHAGC